MDVHTDTFPDATAIPVAAVDGRGTVTLWSPLAQRLLGYPADEIVGRPASRLLAAPLPASARTSLTRSARWSGSAAARHRDGTAVRVPVRACPGPDGDGGVGWLLLTAAGNGPATTPESGSAPLKEVKELKEWAYLQSPIATSVYDDELRLVSVNDEMLGVAGHPEAEMLGLRLADIHPGPPFEDFGRMMADVLRTGRPVRTDAVFRAPGELRERAWASFFTPLRDPAGQVHGVALAALDRTEEHRARQRLALVNEAGARIGTTLDVARTAQELADVTAGPFADFVAVELFDPVLHGEGEGARAAGRRRPYRLRRWP
ncbi:PAS domain-containing protein [Streptomyces sp. NPDC051162]|uniref:PAS domain-containing protein n=1 Tax=unclassified Streptomyces TaxID=2593676 RepID=UPI003439AEF2